MQAVRKKDLKEPAMHAIQGFIRQGERNVIRAAITVKRAMEPESMPAMNAEKDISNLIMPALMLAHNLTMASQELVRNAIINAVFAQGQKVLSVSNVMRAITC